MRFNIIFNIAILSSLCAIVFSASLADSGYPMEGANPQRNYQINRPVLCPSVSNGKSTVLNVVWTWPPADGFNDWVTTSNKLSVDENGYVYVQGTSSVDFIDSIVKIHYTGNFSSESATASPAIGVELTHMQGEEFFCSSGSISYRVSSADPEMTVSATVPNLVTASAPSSFAPYQGTHMVKANRGISNSANPALTFLKISDNTVDTTIPNPSVGFPTVVLVYKNATTEFPIVISSAANAFLVSPLYTKTLPRQSYRYFIDGNEIIVISATPVPAIMKVNALTGEVLSIKNITSLQGQPLFGFPEPSNFMYHNGKSFTQVYTESETASVYADVLNEQIILSDAPVLLEQPIYSNADNTLLTLGDELGFLNFKGFDWGTWNIKLTGAMSESVTNIDGGSGLPVVSNDCHVHVIVGETLYTLAPLPIQNVVPILECIDEDGIGYFTYNNLESKEFLIPPTADRNMLAPLKSAPRYTFSVGNGPRYPLSSPLSVGATGNYTWFLEDYQLKFDASNVQLRCPSSANLIITLDGDSPFPAGFDLIVRDTFVNVTGVNDTRVTIVAKKRSVTQTNTLETELEVAPDPSNQEPTPAQVVRDFVDNQQDEFTQQIASADGSPQNITVTAAGKEPSTSIQGQIPPPVAQPVGIPTSTPQPSTPTDPAPAPGSVSSANKISMLVAVISSILSALVSFM